MATSPTEEDPAGPPASKTTYALERLRHEIASGSIRPGEPLRQADLARRFGVSPTPVREALRLLEAEGTISYSPHRGATVAELEGQRVHDLYLLRSSTESLATRLAVERMAPDAMEQIRAHHRRILDAGKDGDPEQLSAWNRDLHLSIYKAGSPLVTSHVTVLWRMFPTRVTMWHEPEMVPHLLEHHEQIIDAIGRREADEASALMAEHIMSAARFRLEHEAEGV